MAEIRPFAALRYDFEALGDELSRRIAQPYDVLDERQKAALLDGSRYNIVAVDLPHVPAKDLGPPQAYEQAGATFRAWIDQGVLIRERQPAIYAYNQSFDHAGKKYTRRMFLATIRLEPFSAGSVLPHEETFGGPKEDRLALMKATMANLSPVFGLFRDHTGAVGDVLAGQTARDANATAMLDGVENKVWIVTDADAIGRITKAFADLKVYIADGHHRYTTSLNFRDGLSSQRGEPLAEDDPANFVMVAFASMDDPGSLILPTHRVLVNLAGMTSAKLAAVWREGCEVVETVPEADMTLYDGVSGESRHVRFTNRPVLAKLEPGKGAPWRALDVAYLHRYLIDELLARSMPGDGAKIHYIKAEEDALRDAREERGIALICKPATMAQLCAVSETGDRMPQKTTYFYPKVATGLTINPLQ